MTHITRIGPVTVTVLATRPLVLGLFFVEFQLLFRLVEGYAEFFDTTVTVPALDPKFDFFRLLIGLNF